MLKEFVFEVALCSASIGYVAGSDIKTYETIDGEKVPVISSIKEFESLESQPVDSAVFRNVKIDNAFIELFWRVFPEKANYLKFDKCTFCGDQADYRKLFGGEFQIKSLEISGSSLHQKEIEDVISCLYPYTLECINFERSNVDSSVIKNIVLQHFGSLWCLKSM